MKPHFTTCLAPLVAFVGCLTSGCEQTARDLTLDEDKARLACQSFLTAWQEGKKVEELKPEIIGRDYAWDAGDQLVTFAFLSGEKNDGTNLHLPVELSLKTAKGTESKSKVVYVVGTSPVVTVIRE
jgi:hypothetical protein